MATATLRQEYDAALAGERKDRSVAMLGIPEMIAGIRVAALTPRRLEWLHAVENPFACWKREYWDSAPDTAILHFLWFVLPQFSFDLGTDARDEWMESQLGLDVAEAREGIAEYLDRTFLDAPTGSAGVSYHSYSAGLYHALNTSYPQGGWTWQTVMDSPIRVLTQLIKAADIARGCAVGNKRSGEIHERWLAGMETVSAPTEDELDALVGQRKSEGWRLYTLYSFDRSGGVWRCSMRKEGDDGGQE